MPKLVAKASWEKYNLAPAAHYELSDDLCITEW